MLITKGYGSQINRSDKFGNTPLHGAASSSRGNYL